MVCLCLWCITCGVCLSGQDAPSFGLDPIKMHPSFDRMCVHVVCVCPAKMLHLSAWTLSRCTHLLTECVYMWCVCPAKMLHLSAWTLSRCSHLLTECVCACGVCLSGQDAPSFGLDSVKMLPSFDRMCVHVVCVCPAKMLHLSAWTLSRCSHLLTECVYMWCVFVRPRCSIFRPRLCQDAPIF